VNADSVRLVAEALLRFETVTGVEVASLLEGTSLDDLRPEPEPEAEAPARESDPSREAEKPRDEGELDGGLPGTPGLSPA